MSDFLLELRSEEIPARMQAKAREELRWAFENELTAEGAMRASSIVTYSTPRRLVLIAKSLQDRSEAEIEEFKGPKVGAPEQAVDGFLRKLGASRDKLFERDDDKGVPTYFVQRSKPSRATADILATIIPRIVRAFPWPKSMRWGAASASTESARWVRPLQGIVAIFGEDVVACEAAGVTSGAATVGHRFHHPGVITIGGADDYVEKLRACHVIVDHEERAAIIATGATTITAQAGLTLVRDEGLLEENAGLTEWPVPLLGRFDEAYLDVPPEVIQLTARVNQKYFVCQDAAGKLANAFVCTANIDASDGGAKIVEGNRKVLAARLADARFFYETDLKTPLGEQAQKLEQIVFHEKLGTVADKVERVAKLAEWLATEGIVPGCDPALARRAAELAKADLVTGMVGEFPELQGLMGGYYAAAQDEDPQVAAAVRDHYKPVGQGDDVPTAPVTVAVSLADKLDTLAAFFAVDERPTGSKDPFALRRAALGVLAIQTGSDLRYDIQAAYEAWGRFAGRDWLEIADGLEHLRYFFADRLKVQQREAGVRHDLIDAVFALGGEDDLVRLLARVRALQAFVTTEDGTNLLAGYKRAANILKKESWTPDQVRGDGLEYAAEPAEAALITALDVAEPRAREAVAAEDFAGAMAALASLRAPIDAFFESVTVNDPEPGKRIARLALLARVRDAVHAVADFSKIEG